MDRLSTLLSQFGVRASLFYNGNLCGMASYDGADPRGHHRRHVHTTLALALWVWFGLANQKALIKRPGMNAWVWTAMMMIGGSLQTLLFIPVGTAMDVFNATILGFGQSAISHLYLPAFVLAAVASIGGGFRQKRGRLSPVDSTGRA